MIQLANTGFSPGTIVVAAANQPRFHEFNYSMERLQVPGGTRYLIERGCDITQNFNDGIRRSTGGWIWFLGDDHAFQPDMLLRLLKHNVPVVIPPTNCKTHPWLPCIMHGDGSLSTWAESLPLYTWKELSTPGLLALPIGDFIGQAGMLVQKSVFANWSYPWFKAGQQDPGRLQEDMTFCRELQQRGETIWIDCDQVLDHYFYSGVSARKLNGEYVPVLYDGKQLIYLPDATAYRTDDGQTKMRKQHVLDDGGSEEIKSRVPQWLTEINDVGGVDDA
jgi:hypothetical protein